MKNTRGAKIVAGIIVAVPFAAILLYVITTSVGGGVKDYTLADDGGATDWSTISVPSAYGTDEYRDILNDAQGGRWDDAGGYYVRIVCDYDETVLAKARGAVGAKASAQTGVSDGEWAIESTDATC